MQIVMASQRKNRFAPEVPCHRVVAASLDIGGFQALCSEKAYVVKEGRSQLEKQGIAKYILPSKTSTLNLCFIYRLTQLACESSTKLLNM
ncbi:hypothetical protein PsorP6_007591 [Peronosclerospora sorghi]|uniref:Uncharacterized protein n=1 Tax=Peronosclerospora sorghi TaxID=230839 RepID=A0ACC0WBL6_9STRA|nr:hypothetical protein PsorP6_007591 [Peronosclerospora sorghi]